MTKFTPLHWAAMNDNEMVVRTLIAAGADIAARDRDGNTPLHWATAYIRVLVCRDYRPASCAACSIQLPISALIS